MSPRLPPPTPSRPSSRHSPAHSPAPVFPLYLVVFRAHAHLQQTPRSQEKPHSDQNSTGPFQGPGQAVPVTFKWDTRAHTLHAGLYSLQPSPTCSSRDPRSSPALPSQLLHRNPSGFEISALCQVTAVRGWLLVGPGGGVDLTQEQD